jgi:septal ring factor EnvC (AmiA/AmiB activator)
MQLKAMPAITLFMAFQTLATAQVKSSETDILTIYRGPHSYKEVSIGGKTTEVYVDDRKVAADELPRYDSLIQAMRSDVDNDHRDRDREDEQMDRDQERAQRDREQAQLDREHAQRDQERAQRDRERDQEHASRNRERAQAQQERAQARQEREQADRDNAIASKAYGIGPRGSAIRPGPNKIGSRCGISSGFW